MILTSLLGDVSFLLPWNCFLMISLGDRLSAPISLKMEF
jgi:hypothetical protein